MLRVAVVYNHISGEDIAAYSAAPMVAAVASALSAGGHKVALVPLEAPVSSLAARLESLSVEAVFNLFEGLPGEPSTEPLVPMLLEQLALPYTGNRPRALALALHKGLVNAVLRGRGIATPCSLAVTSPHQLGAWAHYPALVKPAAEDASNGITPQSVVRDREELEGQAALTIASYGEALVEPFLEGREFSIAVLGNSDPQPLPPSEVMYTLPAGQPRLVTFGAKWRPEDPYYHNTNTVCPANVEGSLERRLREIASEAYRALGFRGYARFDLRLDAAGEPLLLDANPNPDLSPDAGLAAQARAAGLSYPQLVERILGLALERSP